MQKPKIKPQIFKRFGSSLQSHPFRVTLYITDKYVMGGNLVAPPPEFPPPL